MQDQKICLSFFRVCTFSQQKFFYFRSRTFSLFGAIFTFFFSEPHCVNGSAHGRDRTLASELTVWCLIHYSTRTAWNSKPENNYIFKFPKIQIERRRFTGLLEQNFKNKNWSAYFKVYVVVQSKKTPQLNAL